LRLGTRRRKTLSIRDARSRLASGLKKRQSRKKRERELLLLLH
jgi:hypothetical protein